MNKTWYYVVNQEHTKIINMYSDKVDADIMASEGGHIVLVVTRYYEPNINPVAGQIWIHKTVQVKVLVLTFYVNNGIRYVIFEDIELKRLIILSETSFKEYYKFMSNGDYKS